MASLNPSTAAIFGNFNGYLDHNFDHSLVLYERLLYNRGDRPVRIRHRSCPWPPNQQFGLGPDFHG